MQESALRTDDKRLRIENAAIELFLRQGIGGTSVGQIAQKAGVAKGSVYTYFKDKQAIIDQAVLDKTFEVFEYTLQQAPPRAGGGLAGDFLWGTDRFLYAKSTYLALYHGQQRAGRTRQLCRERPALSAPGALFTASGRPLLLWRAHP